MIAVIYSNQHLIPKIIKAIGTVQHVFHYDTEELNLKKIEALNEIFDRMGNQLFSSRIALVQFDNTDIHIIFEAVYNISEISFSTENPKVQSAAAKLLYKVFITQYAEVIRFGFAQHTNELQAALIGKGVLIALKGFASKFSEVKLVMDELLRKVFKEYWFEHMVLKIASETAREGFSSSDPEIRKGVVIFLTAAAEKYPELNSQITSLISKSNRQNKEKDRNHL